MATNITPIAPDLQSTAAHLAGVKARLACHVNRIGEQTDAQEAEYVALEKQASRLEQQFCAAFHTLTGLRWSEAERIMSS